MEVKVIGGKHWTIFLTVERLKCSMNQMFSSRVCGEKIEVNRKKDKKCWWCSNRGNSLAEIFQGQPGWGEWVDGISTKVKGATPVYVDNELSEKSSRKPPMKLVLFWVGWFPSLCHQKRLVCKHRWGNTGERKEKLETVMPSDSPCCNFGICGLKSNSGFHAMHLQESMLQNLKSSWVCCRFQHPSLLLVLLQSRTFYMNRLPSSRPTIPLFFFSFWGANRLFKLCRTLFQSSLFTYSPDWCGSSKDVSR